MGRRTASAPRRRRTSARGAQGGSRQRPCQTPARARGERGVAGRAWRPRSRAASRTLGVARSPCARRGAAVPDSSARRLAASPKAPATLLTPRDLLTLPLPQRQPTVSTPPPLSPPPAPARPRYPAPSTGSAAPRFPAVPQSLHSRAASSPAAARQPRTSRQPALPHPARRIVTRSQKGL